MCAWHGPVRGMHIICEVRGACVCTHVCCRGRCCLCASESRGVGVCVCVVCARAVGVGQSRAHVLPSAGVKHSLASSLGKHSIM